MTRGVVKIVFMESNMKTIDPVPFILRRDIVGQEWDVDRKDSVISESNYMRTRKLESK